jgi:hypothetical protein
VNFSSAATCARARTGLHSTHAGRAPCANALSDFQDVLSSLWQDRAWRRRRRIQRRRVSTGGAFQRELQPSRSARSGAHRLCTARMQCARCARTRSAIFRTWFYRFGRTARCGRKPSGDVCLQAAHGSVYFSSAATRARARKGFAGSMRAGCAMCANALPDFDVRLQAAQPYCRGTSIHCILQLPWFINPNKAEQPHCALPGPRYFLTYLMEMELTQWRSFVGVGKPSPLNTCTPRSSVGSNDCVLDVPFLSLCRGMARDTTTKL